MKSYDVVVVGGGPAGSCCAGHLGAGGMNVLILDRKTFPRDKVCAGWVTPAVMASLGIDLDDYAREWVLQPISGFRTGTIGGPEVETDYGGTVSYGIRRCELDHYLLQRAAADKLLGTELRSLERRGDRWETDAGVSAPVVVGAGGHFCPVARLVNGKPAADEPVVAAREIEFRMDAAQQARCRVAGTTPLLLFCQDLKGYGWCFRKGDFLNIGLGREDRHGLSRHLEGFCDLLVEQGSIPPVPDRFHGHAYRLYGSAPRRLVDAGLMLVGDAAGLAYPRSGEGIRPAVESGLLAARTLLDADGDYRRERLESYPERLRARLGTPRPRLPVPASLVRFLGRALLDNPWLTRHLLLDRWFLHRNQPALIL